MATASKRRLPYHRRLFLVLLGFLWALVASFPVFQYGREKHFKAERLDARLQLFNLRLLDALKEGIPAADAVRLHGGPFEELRVTVIGRGGSVVYDTSADSLPAKDRKSVV